MKVSLILTVKNELQSINYFVDSLLAQSKKPDEVIIVDAGSNDGTFEKLNAIKSLISNLNLINVPDCNRSKGRNIAIKNAKYDIIAATDFGCSLHNNWLEEITNPIIQKNADVTAGYYLNNDKNIIAVANSFFTHPALFEINENTFLPSTRSIAFKKECWKEINGFDEKFIFGEDTKFSSELRKKNYRVIFNKNAIVYWNAERNILIMLKKIFNYSKWDGIGGFNKFYYLKKSIIVSLLGLLLIISFFNNLFLILLLSVTLFYSIKIIVRVRGKKIGMKSAIFVLILKPIYDFIQSFAFILGSIKKLK